MSPRIAVLGCGTMAGAVVSGLLDSGADRSDVVATAHSEAGRERIVSSLGVTALADNRAAVEGAEIVLIGVKPGAAASVVSEVATALSPGAIVVSIAAGVSIANLEAALGSSAGHPVLRVMPNTPVKVGAGTFIVSGSAGSEDAVEKVTGLLEPLGTVVELPEGLQDAASAVSGSGPAYIFLVAEAMIDVAVEMGIPRPQATDLTVATLAGSAKLMAVTGEHPAILRGEVTSPGGSTAVALHELERHGVRTGFAEAIMACRDRAAEMG